MPRISWVPTVLKMAMGELNVVAAVEEASRLAPSVNVVVACGADCTPARSMSETVDRKSTRLNSSHKPISYAVFCLKKKNKTTLHDTIE